MANEPRPLDSERLEKAARRLRPLEREVLVLASVERLSTAQIAERLDISVEAVGAHLADALSRLDFELERRERPWWRFW